MAAMKYIHEDDPNYFTKDDAAIDFEGNEVCPICGCCSLVTAEVVASIFAQAAAIMGAGTPPEYRLVCEGGCSKTQRHVRVARSI